jgi:hypothetical protein
LHREVRAVDAVPDGPVPPDDGTAAGFAARCSRLMFDHYRAHGFPGSPRVLTALLGRPPRTLADHLAATPLPDGAGELP